MATETERLDEGNEGIGNVEAGVAEVIIDDPATEAEVPNPSVESNPAQEPDYSHLPPELRPVDGKFPELNESLMRKLRGKYFTVKHPRLEACGHKMDLMNEPRTNCEDCWFAWFNTHQKLVEVADEMYRSKGKEALIGMRGKKFFRQFVRFMVTIIQIAKEQQERDAKQAEAAGVLPQEQGANPEGGEVVLPTQS